MTQYSVRLTQEAQDDLKRLYEFWLERDATTADRALAAIESGFDLLTRFPFTCRKAANGQLGTLWRELVIAFGASGYVALFEIENETTITIVAVRHQRESDYH